MEEVLRRPERILIIDEQTLSQSYLRYSLEQLGYQNITFAERAQAALNFCKSNQYDLIICAYNLQRGKDGYQLYEEIKACKVQPLTCGFIFISAETDPSLVYSVVELQPDDFLVKPFSIRELQLRIERVLKRKHQLWPVYHALDKQDLDTALEQTNQLLADPQLHKFFPLLLKIKGDILLEQKTFIVAEQFFQSMLLLQPFSWARIGLVRCYLEQHKNTEALDELEALSQRSDSRLFALDCLAEMAFRQQQFQQAQEHQATAASLAPRNLQRQQKLLQLSRLNHDYETQYRVARDMVKYARYSIYEQPDLYLNLARSSIDYALSLDDEEQTANLTRQAASAISDAKRRFPDQIQDDAHQVLQARLLYLREQREQAKQLLAELDKTRQIDSLEDALDKAKALHEVGLTDASRKLFQQISHHCQQQQSDDALFSSYLTQEKQERASMPRSPRELNNNAVHLYQHGNWEEAFTAFVSAHQVMPKNAGIALNLWQTLLTSPRPLCSAQKKQQLLQQCQEVIENSKLKPEQQARYDQLKQKRLSGISLI